MVSLPSGVHLTESIIAIVIGIVFYRIANSPLFTPRNFDIWRCKDTNIIWFCKFFFRKALFLPSSMSLTPSAFPYILHGSNNFGFTLSREHIPFRYQVRLMSATSLHSTPSQYTKQIFVKKMLLLTNICGESREGRNQGYFYTTRTDGFRKRS